MTAEALLIDDDQALGETLAIGLRKHGVRTVSFTSASEALQALDGGTFDVVVTDLNMREMGGIELCERIAQNRPDVPVIVLTAFGSLDSAVAAIRAGAYDFIKPVEIDALAMAVERAASHHRLQEEVKRLRLEVLERPRDTELIGDSAAMRKVRDLISRVAGAEATVLVAGESGTGKEVVARAIHKRSSRQRGPFIAINCAAVPEALLESELFGHTRGAFTDAKEAHPGLFVQAKGGTLFLDEIGDMPLGLQPKLLRVLQERTVRPLGGKTEVPVDVRIIAATNRDLESAIEEGRFREDLYYRVNVVQVALPPLRARGPDILPLALHFIQSFAAQSKKEVTGFSKEVAEKLAAYAWPGNVRELQNSMDATPTPKYTGNAVSVSSDIMAACNVQFSSIDRAPKFDFDQSALEPPDRDVLAQVAKCVTTGPLKGRSLKLTGRADPRGEVEYNFALGEHRAGSVAVYLGELGVQRTKMVETSRGKLDATGRDEAGWQRDRRVDLALQ